MIKFLTVESKITGFSFFPLLEIGTGIFLMVCSLVVPILFVVYNGIKAEQWGELLFCLGFLVLFMFMGKSLVFQSMQVRKENGAVNFYQNLREPPTVFSVAEADWKGISTRDEAVGEETYVVLYVKIKNEETELYRSVNRKEIKKICDALIKLGSNS
ncbi:MAG: hypothetical protein AB1403_16020 [Candidatus Riflebacteria bacterium]